MNKSYILLTISLESNSQTAMIEENIRYELAQSLLNVRYGNVWQDNSGIFYTTAYIDRNETSLLYQNKIREQAREISSVWGGVETIQDLFSRYKAISRAADLAAQNQALLEQLTLILFGSAGAVTLPYNFQEIKESLNRIKSEMVFSVFSKDRELYRTLTQLLTESGFSVSSSGSFALRGDIQIEEDNLRNGYSNMQWQITVTLVAPNGETLSVQNDNGRASGTDEADAGDRATRNAIQAVREVFEQLMWYTGDM